MKKTTFEFAKNKIGRFFEIFVAFSEYMNFSKNVLTIKLAVFLKLSWPSQNIWSLVKICSNECVELGKDNHFFLSREFTFRQYLDSDTCYETIDIRIIKAKESLFYLDNEVHILRRPQKFDKNILTFFDLQKM
jgi:hypothetical protein